MRWAATKDENDPRAWWARPSSIAVGLGAALALGLACFGWLLVIGYMTGDATSDCAQAFLERGDDGAVLTGERLWFPPHVECTLRLSPTDETYLGDIPDAPIFGVPPMLVVTALGVGGFAFLIRRRHRTRRAHELA